MQFGKRVQNASLSNVFCVGQPNRFAYNLDAWDSIMGAMQKLAAPGRRISARREAEPIQ